MPTTASPLHTELVPFLSEKHLLLPQPDAHPEARANTFALHHRSHGKDNSQLPGRPPKRLPSKDQSADAFKFHLLLDIRTARSTLCRHSYNETSHSLHACGCLRSFLQHHPLSFVEGVLALVIPVGQFPQDCLPEIFQLRLSFLGTLMTALRMSCISFQSTASAPSKKVFGQSTAFLIPSSTLPMFYVHEHLVSPVLLKARPSKLSLTYECGQHSRSILIFTISTDLSFLKNHSIVTKAR